MGWSVVVSYRREHEHVGGPGANEASRCVTTTRCLGRTVGVIGINSWAVYTNYRARGFAYGGCAVSSARFVRWFWAPAITTLVRKT